MRRIDLAGKWVMQKLGSPDRYDAVIPGSVAGTLLAHGEIPDPYTGDNENRVLPVFDNDYAFSRSFIVDPDTQHHDKVLLHCDGLDTLAEIRVNGVMIDKTNNMHRSYVFDVKDILIPGENRIEIIFRSPARYVAEHPSKAGKPFSVLRKAACMFGWDWGLNLPDSGIWRDIYIESFDAAKFSHIHITQQHENGGVTLSIQPLAEIWGKDIEVSLRVIAPDGRELYANRKPFDGSAYDVRINNPQIWWPVGYGDQPLYAVTAELISGGKIVADLMEKHIGIRTLTHSRAEKEAGSEYAFSVNGVPLWFRGENLIIDDALLSRSDNAHWRRLIDGALKSNLNGIRVWGGAYYPPDIFYQLCDEAGIMVFQDFMFACSFYQTDEDFCENVRIEAEQNVQRICHHPCIALYCGNNEIDGMFTVANSTEPRTVALRRLFTQDHDALSDHVRQYLWGMYSQIFLDILPRVCEKWAPSTGYVHSSPSIRIPGGGTSFQDYLSDGDMHYYLQYNGNAPYQRMRAMRSRFMSEVGFQSYPSIKTVASFAKERERRPDSPVMYSHQKCVNGNETIEEYMARDYIVPKNFDDYIYLSQLQAGEIMRYTVEHFRRDSEYNRGMILWQLNDCWPVVSWAGIDYYGRWKALQYFIKRFYAPLTLSAKEEGDSVELWCSNEKRESVRGDVNWQLFEGAQLLDAGKQHIAIPAGKSALVQAMDFSEKINTHNKHRAHLSFALEVGGETISSDSVLFVPAKEFDFAPPELTLTVGEDGEDFLITVSSGNFARRIMLDTREGDCIFSDNWFDLNAGTSRTIGIEKKDTNISSLAQLKEELFTNTLNDVIRRGNAK
ncbi:beta-mannosidase [Spirochaetia bacterium]|nr:beta-mannosidase [Spirochaetia bacterium]